ncbi:MAG: beta family protein [Ignavibacteriaceae bacterium]|nr:beta family protein [Ignavibacteriaceae bacterium]
MFDELKYVPVLKGKQGEFMALGFLETKLKSQIYPLIDLVPNSKKQLGKHIDKVITYFDKWGKQSPIMIDGYMLADYNLQLNNLHPVVYLLNELTHNGFKCIPVVNTSAGPEYNELIIRTSEEYGFGSGLRLLRRAFDCNLLQQDISNALSNQNPKETDLIFDLRSLIDLNINDLSEYSMRSLEDVIFRYNWRNVILAGGSFPTDLAALAPDQVHVISRLHWKLWQALLEKGVSKIPHYSDYAISHPVFTEYDDKGMNASASIRYTYNDDYYIYRGRGTRQHTYKQFFAIAESLLNSSQYYGAGHCLGDEFIRKCATDKKKTGNLTTWRWVGTLHHLTVVADQLEELKRDFNAART